MMRLANVTTTSLWMATSRVTNPNITDAQFNNWYNTALLPAFMQNHNASLAVRYKIIPSIPNPPAWDYVALYKTHERNASHVNYATELGFETSNGKSKRDIGPDDVKIELSLWNPIQTFEGLREKRGQVPAGRPKVACIVRLEPKAGPEGERDVEDWYHYQHLDMLSMLPTYRRSTRYHSADGSKPRWLAVHELDTPDVDSYQGEVLMGTELAHRVMDSVQIFEAANWNLVFETGAEKL